MTANTEYMVRSTILKGLGEVLDCAPTSLTRRWPINKWLMLKYRSFQQEFALSLQEKAGALQLSEARSANLCSFYFRGVYLKLLCCSSSLLYLLELGLHLLNQGTLIFWHFLAANLGYGNRLLSRIGTLQKNSSWFEVLTWSWFMTSWTWEVTLHLSLHSSSLKPCSAHTIDPSVVPELEKRHLKSQAIDLVLPKNAEAD